jgi:regulator of protease activity HflC (stomatin/prohibitin superfamily)
MNKHVLTLIGALVLLILGLWFNPISWNDAGYRTVVTQAGGNQFVQYKPGMFWAGLFSKQTEWPNQLTVSFREDEADSDLDKSSMEIGKIPVRFSEGPAADLMGIVQFILPGDDQKMISIHNNHKTPEHLVKNRLMPYTRECLQNGSQLLTVQAHFGGGRAQLGQDFLDQLQNGAYLLDVRETTIKDSISNDTKTIYKSFQKRDKQDNILRKYSSMLEYAITVADAQLTDVDYSAQVDEMLSKNIESVSRASVSKQNLVTAQQEALTAKAQGERELVTIEYEKKKEQTAQVVAAQTIVEVAKQDLMAQKIKRSASVEEAGKIKTLADANAYEKARMIQADGALQQKLAAWTTSQEYWAKAFSEYQGAIVPQMQWGGNSNNINGATNFMELMGMKAARDLNLDLSNKK